MSINGDGLYGEDREALEADVSFIGRGVFSGFGKLKEINIPSQVKRINSYAFHSCSSLTTIDLSSQVDSIAEDAFEKSWGTPSVIVNFPEGKNPELEIPENKWGAAKVIVQGNEQ